jgi:hypothetical protein
VSQELVLSDDVANRAYWPLSQEEVAVTLQVGMIGNDGWLIASDRCRTSSLRSRVGSETTKLICKPAMGLAYAFSGDDCAILAGEMLEQRWQTPEIHIDVRAALKTLGDESWQQARKALLVPPHPANVRSLLIGTTTQGMWELRIGEGTSIVYDVGDKVAVAGDDSSPALFFIERYYSRNLSVDALMPLAAHVILTGRHFSSYVRGWKWWYVKISS